LQFNELGQVRSLQACGRTGCKNTESKLETSDSGIHGEVTPVLMRKCKGESTHDSNHKEDDEYNRTLRIEKFVTGIFHN
jgi:hypothetical protein